MDDRFDECLAFTLRAEGGYVDDPADPGGATNMGVTLATLREWSDDPSLGANQVQDMSLRTAGRSTERVTGTRYAPAICR